jgi:DNA-binding IclR family transcriptional regulator
MISDEVRRFILTSIPSVPYLEAALLFHADPAGGKTVQDVARALYLRPSAASQLMAEMCGAGLLHKSEDGGELFHYAAKESALGSMVARLAEEYRKNLIEVTHLIHDETQRSATRFAAAFELRRKE